MADEEVETVTPETITVQGPSGAPFVLDVPVPGTTRGEVLVGQMRKGELRILTEDGSDVAGLELEELLAEWDVEVESTKLVRPGRDGPRDRSARVPGDTALDNPPAPDVDPAALVVPEGTVEEVVEWVLEYEADDAQVTARANAALDVEEEQDKPRVTLVERLEAILTPTDDELTAPEGTDEEVVEWVLSDDTLVGARAQAALAVEEAKGDDASEALVEELRGHIDGA